MYKYAREFPNKIIPHITEAGEINDVIHNYKRPKVEKPEKSEAATPVMNIVEQNESE